MFSYKESSREDIFLMYSIKKVFWNFSISLSLYYNSVTQVEVSCEVMIQTISSFSCSFWAYEIYDECQKYEGGKGSEDIERLERRKVIHEMYQ
jgi:hypothetical protein